ncbi:hypothetical protein [Azospirillum endophyticum]
MIALIDAHRAVYGGYISFRADLFDSAGLL